MEGNFIFFYYSHCHSFLCQWCSLLYDRINMRAVADSSWHTSRALLPFNKTGLKRTRTAAAASGGRQICMQDRMSASLSRWHGSGLSTASFNSGCVRG